MPPKIPFPENVPGDFYVEDGCCTSCGMPTTEAPELFAYAPDGHCFVKKQPTTARETYQMIGAFSVQDIGCIRYKGKNRVIQIRLIGVNEGDQCDELPRDLAALNEEVNAENSRIRSWEQRS
jgi:ferredoxin